MSTEDFTTHFLAGNSASLLLFFLVQCKGENELSAHVVSLILRIVFGSHWYHSSAYSCFHKHLSVCSESKKPLCFCQDFCPVSAPYLLKEF